MVAPCSVKSLVNGLLRWCRIIFAFNLYPVNISFFREKEEWGKSEKEAELFLDSSQFDHSTSLRRLLPLLLFALFFNSPITICWEGVEGDVPVCHDHGEKWSLVISFSSSSDFLTWIPSPPSFHLLFFSLLPSKELFAPFFWPDSIRDRWCKNQLMKKERWSVESETGWAKMRKVAIYALAAHRTWLNDQFNHHLHPFISLSLSGESSLGWWWEGEWWWSLPSSSEDCILLSLSLEPLFTLVIQLFPSFYPCLCQKVSGL